MASRRGTRVLGAAVAALALTLTACGGTDNTAGAGDQNTATGNGSASAPPPTEHVKVILDYVYNEPFAPIAYGIQKGIFAKNGVDLEVIPGRGGDLAMQQINQGKVEFAFTDLSALIRQRIKGETDTTAVYAWIPDPQICVASLEPLNSPKDMEGKTFATVSFSNGKTTVPYVLKQNGVDISKVKVQILDIAVLIPQLLSGSVDTAESAIPGSFASNAITAEKANKKLYCTKLSDWGYRDYGKLLIVQNDLIKSNPDLVKRVVTGFDESVKTAIAEASGEDLYEALKKAEPQTNKEEVLRAWEQDKEIGNRGPIDPAAVEYSMQFLKDTENLTTDMKPDEFYDNSFIGTSS